ncbi:glycoside hydrolase family 78 protein [Calycina marina]|uniref:Glycoside hydrolase family 78 protein n=1 Tax=Calycina marina TaxID=1763456 RepID=A0A9P7ZC10_9HELO|nr:glycoside hydrolase family 78 protein [Calycina marina]
MAHNAHPVRALPAVPDVPAAVTSAPGSCWRNTPCTGPAQPSFPGAWEANNFSPATRQVIPARVLKEDGSLLAQWTATSMTSFTSGPLLVFDFGKEVGGIVTITYAAVGSGPVGVSFTEAKNWTGVFSDDSNGAFNTDGQGHADGFLTFTAVDCTTSTWTLPDANMRGGFRYLSLNNGNNVDINILNISLDLSFAPEWPNLRAYGGYFDSNDDLLNKIWYAGAYTLQTNSIPHNTGRIFPIISPGWINDADISLGTGAQTVYVDGSKRDRTLWAGDLAIAVPSILTSLGDISGVRTTLGVMYKDQRSDGALPFAGPNITIYDSDTYHMATLIGTYDYFWFSGDTNFLATIWPQYKLAMQFIIAKIDSTGLLFVTGNNDWGRLNQGGRNSEANMLLFHTLQTGSKLATAMSDSAISAQLAGLATKLQVAANANLYDAAAGAFKDTDNDASIHPQDANSMALLFSIANTSFVPSISKALTKNWIAIGAVAPELPNNLCGFGQSFEVKGHLVAGQATRALDLIRRAWGWYQNHALGTASTHIEGYLADGTFGYRSTSGYGSYSYTSHAHGWSTGPVDALTTYIVGLQISSPGGSTWTLAPQFGDLTRAEAGFTTPKGKFTARWKLIPNGYEMSWDFPGGTVGTIVMPTLGNSEPKISGSVTAAPGVLWKGAGGWNNKRKTFTVQNWVSDGTVATVQVLAA